MFKRNWLDHVVKNTFGTTEAFRGKIIVDAGSGSGNQALWMLEAGAKFVYLLELSDSVFDAVKKTLEKTKYRNYAVIKCSIDEPPLKAGLADMVYCHNVIQHTPSVQNTAKALFRLVRPGGEFVFNCYPLDDRGILRWIRFHLVYKNLRWILSKLPFSGILAYAKLLGALRLVPALGWFLEKSGFCLCGNVPRNSFKKTFHQTVLNTFDLFGSHEFQHHLREVELIALLSELQPDPLKIGNFEKYFKIPPPIGCALRVRK